VDGPAALQDRSLRKLNSLLEVSKAMAAAIDLDSLLGVILDRATAVMEAERASLFIYDEETGTLWNRISGSLGRGELRLPLGTGIAGRVAQTGVLLNIPDAYADPRFTPEVDRQTGFRTRSILCAPLVGHAGRLTGVIQLLNKSGGGVFTREDEEMLEAFASHAAVALDRARLVEAFVEKERIEEALRLAHDIQMGMLPRPLAGEGRVELAAALEPARSVGGDLYDFLVEGDRLWFMVGDVSGKGVASALFMAVAKTLFRASIQTETPLATVLARVNRELCRDNERAMFVTAFAGCLDLASGEAVVSNAGHNPPYRLGPEGSVAPAPEAPGIPLGVIADYVHAEARLRLGRGEALFLYTDGVTEATNAQGEAFGAGRLEAFLAKAAAPRPEDLVRGSLAAVRDFEGGTPPSDDLTVMAIRYLGG